MENEKIINTQNQSTKPEKKKKPMKIERSNKLFAIISSSVLGLLTLFYVLVLGLALINSFKHQMDMFENPIGLPSGRYGWHFENFAVAFQIMKSQIPNTTIYVGAPEMLLNSLIFTVGVVFGQLFVTALVSYCCAKYNYKICKIIYAVVIVVIMLPIVGSMPSAVQMSRTLGFYDNFIGIIIQMSGFCNMNFLIFYGAFKAVPKTYSEAAMMDGAGQWSIYFRIVLPLVKSSLLAVGLLQIIAYWNDFSTPMMYLPSHPVLALGLQQFQNSRSQYATDPVKLASTLICCAPVLVLFICFRKKLMSNITFGGLKG